MANVLYCLLLQRTKVQSQHPRGCSLLHVTISTGSNGATGTHVLHIHTMQAKYSNQYKSPKKKETINDCWCHSHHCTRDARSSGSTVPRKRGTWVHMSATHYELQNKAFPVPQTSVLPGWIRNPFQRTPTMVWKTPTSKSIFLSG